MGRLRTSFACFLRRAAEDARRRKLRSAGAAQEGLPDLGTAAGARRHVAIIGAGLSGLCAAYLLRQAGHRVTVLEARNQPGGRVLTRRDRFADGLYADAGAARIADIHHRTLAWTEHFALGLEPMYPDMGHLVTEHDGRAVRGADAARLSSHDIHHILVGHVSWDTQWPASRSTRLLVHNSFVKPIWYRIRDGMDRLPRAFADRLRGSIRYGAPVTAIKRDATGIDLRFQESGRNDFLRADFVVCALPNTVLRRICVSPELPRDKSQLIERSRCESATRVFLQLRDRAWLPPHCNGYGLTSDKWEIWNPRFTSTERNLLVVYAHGEAALPFAALAPEARIARALARVESLFPRIRESLESASQICWDEDPWSSGAQHVGDLSIEVARRSEGRVFFAGAHTSTSGWMDGALESGHRVAAEILASIERKGVPCPQGNITSPSLVSTA